MNRENTPATVVAFAGTLWSFLAAPIMAQAPSSSSAPPDEIVSLSTFEVREDVARESYRATESISASGIVLPLEDISVPVQVITSALMEDRGARDILDVVYLAPGVTTNGPAIAGQQSFIIRGYAAPGMRNGLRLENDLTDTAEIERVEIARGPTAVLYGSGATGGVVNRITKKPKFTSEGSLTLAAGSYNYYRAMLDVTGPIAAARRDGKPALAYRFTAQQRHNESDLDWYEIDRTSLSGSLRWNPTERLMFTVEYSRTKRDSVPALEVPAPVVPGIGMVYAKNPTGRGHHFSIVGPDGSNDLEGGIWEMQGTLLLAKGLALNAIVADYSADYFTLRARDLDVWATTGRGRLESDNETTDMKAGKLNLLWESTIRNIDNKLLLTYERTVADNTKALYSLNNWVTPPDFRITPQVRSAVFAVNPGSVRNRERTLVAYRLNHFASALQGRLHTMWGIRHDEDAEDYNRLNGQTTKSQGETTYQLGAVYDVMKGVGLFANYSTDFVPNSQSGRFGQPLDSQEGNGYEAGVKLARPDGRLTGTISYFHTIREKIARRRDIADDPATPNVNERESFFELSGKERSRGVDFDLIFTPVESLTLYASGSFFDTKTVTNIQDPTQVGLPPQDTCPKSISVQSLYRLGPADSGWSLGFGGYWRDDYPTEGNSDRRRVRTDDHYILSALVRKKFTLAGRAASFTINVDNVLDRQGYIKNQETFGEPLTVQGTLRYHF